MPSNSSRGRIARTLSGSALLFSILAAAVTWTIAGFNFASRTTQLARTANITYFGNPNLDQRRGCRTLAHDLAPISLSNIPSRKEVGFYSSTVWTIGDKPSLTYIPYPDHYTTHLKPDRDELFRSYITVEQADLDTRTATLGFYFFRSGPSLPTGTTYSYLISGAGSISQAEFTSEFSHGGGSAVSVTFPLIGSPSAYPDDTYHLLLYDMQVIASIPGIGNVSYPVTLLDPSMLVATSTIAVAHPGMYVQLASPPTPEKRVCYIDPLIIFSRSGTPIFVWIMVGLPMALILIVVGISDRNRRRDSQLSSFELLATGITLLTLLSLRVVLVPSSIMTLTSVDYVLGAELATIVSITVWNWRRSLTLGTDRNLGGAEEAQGSAE